MEQMSIKRIFWKDNTILSLKFSNSWPTASKRKSFFSITRTLFFSRQDTRILKTKQQFPLIVARSKSEKKIGKIPQSLLMPQLRMTQNKLSLPKKRKLSKVRNRKKKLCLVICASPYVTNHSGVKKFPEDHSYFQVPSF